MQAGLICEASGALLEPGSAATAMSNSSASRGTSAVEPATLYGRFRGYCSRAVLVLFGRPRSTDGRGPLRTRPPGAQRQAGRPVRAGPQDRTYRGEARHSQPSPSPTPRYELAHRPNSRPAAGSRRGRWAGCCGAGSRSEQAHTNGDRGSHTGSPDDTHLPGLDNLWTESSTALWQMEAMVTWAFESAGSAGALFAWSALDEEKRKGPDALDGLGREGRESDGGSLGSRRC
jgi:hypothetical protein